MLPVKLLEYATLGIPVICARLRTIEHYFSEKSVRFFSPNNAGQLARAIQDLYLDPALRDRPLELGCESGQELQLAHP